VIVFVFVVVLSVAGRWLVSYTGLGDASVMFFTLFVTLVVYSSFQQILDARG
jgi:hypothetical protein